jgi:divalent metal cation (Fe/Co/Zn/Cd) transporter
VLLMATESAASPLSALFGSAEADHSAVGIVLASECLLVTPFLSYAPRRTGRELGSATAVADSKQTLLSTYLSAVLLWDSSSTACSVGRGPIRSQDW